MYLTCEVQQSTPMHVTLCPLIEAALYYIIIPCFNEETRLNPDIFLCFLRENQNISFIFVDDGSTDSTLLILNTLEISEPNQISVLKLGRNSGKAEAVRQGVLHALKKDCSYVGYWDADLATPLEEILEFKKIARLHEEKSFISGARIKRLGAEISRHWYRHYFGRIFATIVSNILNLPIYDSQCGAKLIKKNLAERIFAEAFLSAWLFDVELLARIIEQLGRKEAYEAIYELPLSSWEDKGQSKISVFYLPKIPIELVKIRLQYRKHLEK